MVEFSFINIVLANCIRGMPYVGVLVLAGVELMFFISPARTGLRFGLLLKAVLIIQGCYSYFCAVLTQSQGLFSFSSHPTSEQAGGAQEAGRGHNWDS